MSISADFSIADRQFMAEAIHLAGRGLYTTTSNPRVGCVLVNNDKVVGRGWHQVAGQGHAEVNAIADAGDRARGATAYISLEPCGFVGKTGACTDALQAAGIIRVVSAMEDPNPKVSGQGHAALRAACIEVSCGLMAAEATALNVGFIQRMTHQLPWVTCKMAMSLDGRSAMASGESQWITAAPARRQVQRLRARSCAIVTGVGTIISDDPSLNLREKELVASTDRQPALVIVDSQLRTPLDANVLTESMLSARDVYIGCVEGAPLDRINALQARGVQVIELVSADEINSEKNAAVDLSALLSFLADQSINEVLVEAGPILAGQFLSQQLVNELKIFVAPKLMGADAMPVFGLYLDSMSQAVDLDIVDIMAVGSDWLFTCRLAS